MKKYIFILLSSVWIGMGHQVAGAQLTNNYSQDVYNLRFYQNKNHAQVGSTLDVFAAFGTVDIPTNAVVASMTAFGTTIECEVFDNVSSNIFGTGIIFNNASVPIQVDYYGTVYGMLNWVTYTPITVLSGHSIPIVTAAYLLSLSPTSDIFDISSNNGYIVNNNDNVLTLDPYVPTLFNNYSQDVANLNLYTINNELISSQPIFEANSFSDISIAARYASFDIFNTTFLYDLSLIPVENIVTENTVTNSLQEDVEVVFFGQVNSNSNAQLNSSQVLIPAGQSIPFVTGAATITVYSASSPDTILVGNSPIEANTNYFINFIDTDWTIYPQPLFINNGHRDVINLRFYDAIGQVLSTVSLLSAGQSVLIPISSAYVILDDIDTALIFQLYVNQNVNIFTQGSLTNNTNQNVRYMYFGVVNDQYKPSNSSEVIIHSGETIPVVTGATHINIYTNSYELLINQELIDPLIQSYINSVNNVWTINDYQAAKMLYNNGNQSIASLTYYDINNIIIGSLLDDSLSAGAATQITFGGVKAILIALGVTLTIPLSTIIDSDVFTGGTFTNNSAETAAVTYYGIVNGDAHAPLNNGPILIAAGQSIPIATGATTANVASMPLLVEQPSITSGISYIINENDATWTMSQAARLTNNSITDITNLAFYNAQDVQIGETRQLLVAGDSVFIPLQAVKAVCTDYDVTITIPVSGSQSSNIYGSGRLTNPNVEAAAVIYYDSDGNSLHSSKISIPAQSYVAILTVAASVSVYVQDILVIDHGVINPNTSTAIYYNGTWFLAAILLKNNQTPAPFAYVQDVQFYNTAGSGLSNSFFIINSQASIPIPINSVKSSFGINIDNGAVPKTVSIPINDLAPSNIITQGGLSALYSNPPMNINYYGTINGRSHVLLNSYEPFVVQPGQFIPFLIGTESIDAYSNNKLYLSNASVNPDLRYTIVESSGNFTLVVANKSSYRQFADSSSEDTVLLTNNYERDITNLTFYDNNGAKIGITILVLSMNDSVIIPPTATQAVFTDLDSTLTIPVSDALSSNIFTHEVVINNSSQSIAVNFYNASNLACNGSPIIIPVAGSVPIMQGATRFSIVSLDLQISGQLIEPSQSYYITLNNGNWLLTKPEQILPQNYIYGSNELLFVEFLYINFYALTITDGAAQAATIAMMDSIINIYVNAHASQPGFNFLLNAFELNASFDTARSTLVGSYPGSRAQIYKFFALLALRINQLVNVG